ncbi:YegS/Rv2252/BmrU family lipid kinase [Ruminiclostridium cellulolyticum]|uniref:Diacylglycerol kinase catalytic region n=1 Tax=Ruminiclostridium cellulolyticum (strain ATCC 35319 / DSM 5812 / JCM 6584 / H10) TaxID=394503 RepID=B8I2A1_RUMCH|nr:YegS/Rv2252/BmrU family lipid kinase [Ruminiclostridium cellulolyticum]ACL77764.1 diacylglycerol kinase catalytic region [Ruminiclostridium cellulolyticum H10]
MKNALFVYNPVSGGHRIPSELDFILSSFQEKGILAQPYRLTDANSDYLINALQSGVYDFVAASGGDGTINFVANLLLNNDIKMPLGVIPSGTCNDFAKCLGINSLKESIDIILQGETIMCDVGYINNSQYFLSTFAGGNFVDVSFNTNSELKKNFGPFAYYLKGISEVANIKSFDLKITADEHIIEGKFLLFLIVNGKQAAGFPNLLKQADYTDGYMDIILVKKCSNINLASIFFKVLSKESVNDKNVIILKARKCELSSKMPLALTVDGERSELFPASIEFKQRILEVFVPIEEINNIS